MGIELATIGQVVVALANLATANIGKKRKMADIYGHSMIYLFITFSRSCTN